MGFTNPAIWEIEIKKTIMIISRKHFYCLCGLLISSCSVFCQGTLTLAKDSVLNNDSIFDKLDKSKITTGVLYDKAFLLTDVSKYDGIYDTVNNLKNWENIYAEIINASVNTPQIPALDTVMNLVNPSQDPTNQVIPIGIINFNYNFIKATALDSAYLLLQNSQLYDNPNSTTSPYDVAKIFTIAPLQPYIIGTSATFSIVNKFYFSNVSDALQSMAIDFGDGAGYRDVHFGDMITVNYSSSGFVQLKVKATYQNQILNASSFFQAGTSSGARSISSTDLLTFQFNASVPSQYDFGEGATQTAKATVYYGCGNSGPGLVKPFIFVEGFDPGIDNNNNIIQIPGIDIHSLHSQTQYGSFDWDQFFDGGSHDYDGDTHPDYPQIALSPVLIDKLHDEGFDIVFLDQKNGTDYIQRNAMTVVELINWVNQNKTGNEKLVVAGASMGGLVTKFALRYMENNNMTHNTKLWITFDSPHNGANIPLGDQYFLKFFASSPKPKPSAIFGVEIISTPAAQQMLVYNFNSFPYSNSFRSSLINDNNFNYPNNLKKIAIANGSILGINGSQGYGWGAQMVDLNVGNFWGKGIGKTWAVPDYHNGGTQTVFDGKKKFMGLILASEKDDVSGTLPYDNAPGGIANTNELFAKSGATVYYQNHCFIPVVSSLAIDPTFISNTDGFYNLFYNIQGNIMQNSNNNNVPNDNIAYITNHNISPFDVIMGPSTGSGYSGYGNTDINANQQHVEISQENIEWFVDEISPNNLFLQNQTITDANVFEARNTITTGSNVTNTIPVGDFVTNSGSVVDMHAGQSIDVKDGTWFKAGSDVHLYIEDFPCAPSQRMMENNNSSNGNSNNNPTQQNTPIAKTNPPVNNDIGITPNPNNGTFQISVTKNNQAIGVKDVKVYDMVGRVIWENNAPSGNIFNVDISGYAPGIYYVRALNEAGDIDLKKLIKE